MTSVLFEMVYTGTNQFFQLNSEELTAFPNEQEVLLQDGVQFKVINVKETFDNRNMKLLVVRMISIADHYVGLKCCSRTFQLLAN